MFNNLKDKLTEKFKTLTTELRPQDEYDKALHSLVERGTSESLIGPDWQVNLQFVDYVNQNPAVYSDKALRALRSGLVKHNAKVQLLSLTMLETCVKNSHPSFHAALAASDLWSEMVRIAGDTSISRADGEVRDKILSMVEDYARGLGPHQFKEAYDALIGKGVDFPVRAPEEQMPLYTPPLPVMAPPLLAAPQAPTAAPAAAPHGTSLVGPLGSARAARSSATTGPASTAAWAVQASSGNSPGGAQVDPFAEMSPEDRVAVAAAMAEMEAEEHAVQAAAQCQQAHGGNHQGGPLGRSPAALAMQPGWQPPVGVVLQPAPPGLQAPHAGTPVGAGEQAGHGHQPLALLPQAGRPVQQQPVEVEPPEDIAAALLVAKNSTELLNEMLATVPSTQPAVVHEPFIAELAEQCTRMRARLEHAAGGIADEAQLVAALAQHEELAKVLARYDGLLALAPRPATHTATGRPVPGVTGVPAPSAVVAAATATTVAGGPAAGAGALFTLVDKEEEAVLAAAQGADGEEEEDSLVTRRHQGGGDLAMAAGGTIGPRPQVHPAGALHPAHAPAAFTPPPPVPEESPVGAPELGLVPAPSPSHPRPNGPSPGKARLPADPFIHLLGDEVPHTAHHEDEAKAYDEQYGGHYESAVGTASPPPPAPPPPPSIAAPAAVALRGGASPGHTVLPQIEAPRTTLAASTSPYLAADPADDEAPLQLGLMDTPTGTATGTAMAAASVPSNGAAEVAHAASQADHVMGADAAAAAGGPMGPAHAVLLAEASPPTPGMAGAAEGASPQ